MHSLVLLIRTVERMADEQGMKELKFKNRFGDIYQDVDLIAGVNEEEEDEEDDDDYIAGNGNEDEDEIYDEEIDPEELAELLEDENGVQGVQAQVEDANEDDGPDEGEGVQQEEADDVQPEPEVVTDQDGSSEGSELRRSTRQRTEVERLVPSMRGQSYLEKEIRNSILKNKKKTVRIMEDEVRKLEVSHNIVHQVQFEDGQVWEYDIEDTMLITRLIGDLQNQVTIHKDSFAQQYILQKGLKVFGQKGHSAAKKELEQLDKRICFYPVAINEMTSEERKKAQQALMFLCEKRDRSVKGRMVYDGKPTREWMSREDVASPTAALESIILTSVVDSFEERDVMTCDIPNAFIQAEMPEIKDGEERIMMKIQGILVDMLVDLNPNLYGPKVVYENGKKVIYVWVLRAIYGMLEAALLWYKKFRKQLEENGFKFNPYDPCVANKEVDGSQQTIIFHVDDLKSSHKNSKVNDEFIQWLNNKYGEHGEVTSTRGKHHEYLGMTLNFEEKGAVKIEMAKYVEEMLKSFPIQFSDKQVASTPAGDRIFDQGTGKTLEDKRKEVFHTTVAKGLFLAKRGRPDIQATIALLCTRVQAPNEADWNKLIRLMKYLNGTKDKCLRIRADSISIIKWYVDASFAVHPDFKSQSGAVMTMGKGAVQSISRKQKLNTRSSTESELVGVDDVATMILWTKLFLEAQGFDIQHNIVYQDNRSAILLEVNGKRSAGKRSRALNIRYFFVTDQVEKGNMEIQYCPTEEMVGDYHTKPLQGSKFVNFRTMILGE